MDRNNLQLVSVVMITYAHENFIEQAISSVLMQECDFDVELIIVNDCSTDNTDAVIKKIVQNHPKASWIKYIKHDKNIGSMPNFIFALKEAQGKYIALCEGDDYWTDPLKLQKQVTFLEDNIEYVLCGTYCNVLRINGLEKRKEFKLISFSFYDIINNNIIPTLTICFKNNIINYEILNDYPIGDIPLLLELLRIGGKGAKLPINTAVYRYHGNGANSGNTRFKNVKLQFQTKYSFSRRYHDNKFNKLMRNIFFDIGFQEVKWLLKLNFKEFDYKIIYIVIVYYFKK
jgi:glycosyltransferase involved in cell wall biosynthesis